MFIVRTVHKKSIRLIPLKLALHEQQNCCNLQQNLISTHVNWKCLHINYKSQGNMWRHFYLTFVEITFCCKLQQFCCSSVLLQLYAFAYACVVVRHGLKHPPNRDDNFPYLSSPLAGEPGLRIHGVPFAFVSSTSLGRSWVESNTLTVEVLE
jgi:hypothetical protein